MDYDTSQCRLLPTLCIAETSLAEYALHECDFRLAVSPEGAVGLICGALAGGSCNTVWLAPDDARTLLKQLQGALTVPSEDRHRLIPPNPYTPWAPGKFTLGSPSSVDSTTNRFIPRTKWELRGDDVVTMDGKERWDAATESWVKVEPGDIHAS